MLHHPFLFKGKPTQCSRGSKKDFWRRCRGGLRKSQHTKYPSQTLISRITLFAICLSFSSPPLHPCRFIRPLFSVRLFFACLLCAYVLDCLSRWLKIILNCVTFPIFIIKYQKYIYLIILSLSKLTFAGGREGIDNPFIALVASSLFVCVGAWDF